MKRFVILFMVVLLSASLFACTSETEDPALVAREKVIKRWREEADDIGTGKYIEDIYKAYPNDEVIANVHFYSIAKEYYGHYESLGEDKYLETAKEYASKIDPNYTGEFSDEIHLFVSSILTPEEAVNNYSIAKEKEDRYISLTNSEKKEICNYIQERYDYYDAINGGYAGDKYSDAIMQEAAEKYGLTVSQIEIIWMNMYSY